MAAPERTNQYHGFLAAQDLSGAVPGLSWHHEKFPAPLHCRSDIAHGIVDREPPLSRLSDKALAKLARDLAGRVHRDAPDWTGFNESDPGVTLVQLFEFLAEQLLYRAASLPDKESTLARVSETLAQVRGHGSATASGLTRVRYFAGQLLTADDFQTEQDYHRAKLRRLTLSVVGVGIVSGLHVKLGTGSKTDAPVVSVSPGSAIAPNGEELVICEQQLCTLSASVPRGFVTLRFVDEQASQASRISEGVAIEFHAQLPPDAIAIARLVRKATKWVVDRKFRPIKTPAM